MLTRSTNRVWPPVERLDPDLEKLNEELSRTTWEVHRPRAEDVLEALLELARNQA